MAPRRRARKYNLDDARMEVAVEHLAKKGWGFDENVVRKVASELLQEYEEDGSWFFIELEGYALLVEKILEYQETNDHGDGGGFSGAGIQDESVQDETTSEHALAISGDALTTVDETASEQALAISGEPLTTVDETTNEQALAITGGSPVAVVTAENDLLYDTTAREIDDGSRLMLPNPICDKAIVTRKRKRRPCYGLIIDDDEDDDKPQELLLLTPAGEIDKVIPVPKTQVFRRKRRSMWDLKPGDP